MSGTPYGDAVLDIKGAAEYCDYSVHTFRDHFRQWGLEPTKMGGKNFWFKTDLDKFKAGRIPERYGAGIRWRQPRQGEAA